MPSDPLQGFSMFMQGLNTLPRAGRNIEAEQRSVARSNLQNQAIDSLLSQIANVNDPAALQAAPQSALAALFAPTQDDALKLLSGRVANDQTLTQNVDNEVALQKERERQFADTLPGLVTSLGGNEEMASTIDTAARAKRYDIANNLLAQLFGRNNAAFKARLGAQTPNRRLEEFGAYGKTLAYFDKNTTGVLPSIVNDALLKTGNPDLNADDELAVLNALNSPDVQAEIIKSLVGSGVAGRAGTGQAPRAVMLNKLFSAYVQNHGTNPALAQQILQTIGRTWTAGQVPAQAISGASAITADTERAAVGIEESTFGGEISQDLFDTGAVQFDDQTDQDAINALEGGAQ